MKFQDTSIHRLKVKKKWCGHTDKPKAICPTNFFKVGGIKSSTTLVTKESMFLSLRPNLCTSHL